MATIRRWVFGRAADCNVVINYAGVSGHHCCLIDTGQGFFLEDLHSSNGTFVNGVQITAKIEVQPSDRITLGRSVVLPWPAEPKPAAVVPPEAISATAIIPPSGHVPATPAVTQAKPSHSTPSPAAPTTKSEATRTVLAPQGGSIVTLTIGRGPTNDIRLDYATVSAHHARVLIGPGQAWIEDLGSTNGTAIGHPDRKIKEAFITEGDVVFFGSLRVPASRLLTGKLNLGEQAQQTISFRGNSIVLGRDPGCDQVLDSPMVSRRHARLTRRGTDVLLEDLGSANGTFVNGQRISQAAVHPGDRIGLGGYTFTLNDDGVLEKRDLSGNLTLEARNIAVDVPHRRLIENVSLTIYPFEFVGLMGPSGAGKTTLMNALNGYTPPTEGEVLLNGQSLYLNYGQFANHLGYVPQDDIIHRDLTVRQSLYYTARLRLPPDTGDAEIHKIVTNVIEKLGLVGTEDTLIGSPEKKGISGGQRKRVNLAMELLTNPLVLFLDEPTSGLSSEDALLVMQLLKKLTEEGKTILITIHQPSLEVFRLLTHLAIVSKDGNSPEPGKLVYFGPAYPDSIRFFNPPNSNHTGASTHTALEEAVHVRCSRCSEPITVAAPLPPSPDEVLRGLDRDAKAGIHTTELVQRYTTSEYYRKYVHERAERTAPQAAANAPRSTAPSFLFLQWWTLVRRCLTIKLRDRGNLIILAGTAVTIGILVWAVFHKQLGSDKWDEKAKALVQTVFILSLGGLWFGTSNSVREIVAEWAIYRRERMVNLKIIPYVASKFAVLGLLCLVQCVLLLGIIYLGCGLKASLGLLFGLLFLTSLVGIALGLTLSAVARTPELAGTLFTWVLLTMIILSGAVQPVHKMPEPGSYICGVIPSRWAFEAVLVAEAEQRERSTPPSAQARAAMPSLSDKSFDMASKNFPKEGESETDNKENHRLGTGFAAGALAVLLVLFTVATHLILRYRDIH